MIEKAEFEHVVHLLSTKIDKYGNKLNINSLMISDGINFYNHYFREVTEMVDLRSLSKPIIGLALGIAMENGMRWQNEYVTLDTKVYPFLTRHFNFSNSKNLEAWKKVTIRHLLTHSIGYDTGLLFSSSIKDLDKFTLVEYLLDYDIVHEPGTKFIYSNAGPYLLSALIKKELGQDLDEWISLHLFRKIGITEYSWKKYGDYCAAATGLKLRHKDVHKIGKVMFDKGVYDGQRLISEAYLTEMTTVQITTPEMYDEQRVFPKYGYGFFVYICKNGTYYVDGTDGQYMIIVPSRNILITTLACQPDMRPITECLKELS